jgi:hypothetical protein
MKSQISSQADYNPDHYHFARSSGLPRDYFFVSQRVERIGGAVLVVVMSGAAAFIVAGLAFGWFA